MKKNELTSNEFVDILREFLGYSSINKAIEERGSKERNEKFHLENPGEIESGVKKAS
jgi:hypothetical protein